MDGHVDSEPAAESADPVRARSRRRLGRVLCSKWRLDTLLGVGGMAAVYAATHRNGSRVAVKILHPELLGNTLARTRFLREGYVANAVGHEGAVRVIDDDTAEDGSLFLVTELLEGETLERRLRREGGGLSEDDVLCIADQLLGVLVAAHAKGIVHRDLKPENVLITHAGRVKVLDFGIARLRELSLASRATSGNATLGTPSYMPPEQARGLWDQVDGRADIWAVGANMFYLLTGRDVHDGRTTNELLLRAMTEPAQRLESLLPTISPAVAQIVDRALAFERDQRWPDASRMKNAVRSAYFHRHGATIPAAVPRSALAAEGAPSAVAHRRSAGSTGWRTVRITPMMGRRGRHGRVSGRQRSLTRGWVAALAFCTAVSLAAVAIIGRVTWVGRSASDRPRPLAANSGALAPAPHAPQDPGREPARRAIKGWEPAPVSGTPPPAPIAVFPPSPFPVPEVAATDLPSAPPLPPAWPPSQSAPKSSVSASLAPVVATAAASAPAEPPSATPETPEAASRPAPAGADTASTPPIVPGMPAGTSAPPNGDCDPPYTLDGTRLHFKAQCL
jgi:serine/threonine-protein kinase